MRKNGRGLSKKMETLIVEAQLQRKRESIVMKEQEDLAEAEDLEEM